MNGCGGPDPEQEEPARDARAAALERLQGGRERRAAAATERARYERFLGSHELPDTPDAVALWLTWLLDTERPSGSRLRYRLRLLDIAAVMVGRPPPGDDLHLRSYVRGLHREASLGTARDRTPLYAEDVRAVLDSIDADRTAQNRDVAMLLLAAAVGLPSDVLCRLEWRQLRIRKDHLLIRVDPRERGRGPSGLVRVDAAVGELCPVAAVRDLRRQVGPAPGPVFARRDGVLPAPGTFADLLVGRDRPWRPDAPRRDAGELARRVQELRRPSLTQARDRAIFAIAYSACLTNTEASALTVDDLEPDDRGLIVHVPGREGPTAVPSGPDRRHCPVTVWRAWAARLAEEGYSDGAAFPAVAGRVVLSRSLRPLRLNAVVSERCRDAGLRGEHTFTSLRLGFVRSAARDGVPEHAIMRQAGLQWLHSVDTHVQRERLVSHSLAGRIGL